MSHKPLLPTDAVETVGHGSLDLLLSEKSSGPLNAGRARPNHRCLMTFAVAVSIILNVLLSCRLAVLEVSIRAQNPNQFWTPFNSNLKYHIQRFTSGFGHQISQWQGSASEEKDQLWQDLYVESFLVPKVEAAKLANKTVPISEEPGSEYITSFSVFHYLHCLNMIRKVSEHIYFPEYYNLSATNNQFTVGLQNITGFEELGKYSHVHIDHCIDSLRQALMCKPDLGPVVWQWDRQDERVDAFAETVHTCANWDDLLGYAREREYLDPFVQDQELEPAGQCGVYDENCQIRLS